MRITLKFALFVFLIALVLARTNSTPAMAAPALIADLSRDHIEITTSFSGTRLLLFGATEGVGDVVVVVRGPNRREVIRKKQRIMGIWVNRESVTFEDVPGYYFQASTRPLSEIADKKVLAEHRIGTTRLPLKPLDGTPSALVEGYRSALLRLKQAHSLYSPESTPIEIIGGRLFRVELVFPSNVPTGLYAAEVYLFQKGRAVSIARKTLAVRKAGVEATIFEFAHQHSAIYGIFAIAVALFAGWLAGVIFRKV
ncbi:MAG: TIGR02186 family protein [Proteobacteria bacterium]|nr:TIGR02186 family protein [Pseudomonadota bacterium]